MLIPAIIAGAVAAGFAAWYVLRQLRAQPPDNAGHLEEIQRQIEEKRNTLREIIRYSRLIRRCNAAAEVSKAANELVATFNEFLGEIQRNPIHRNRAGILFQLIDQVRDQLKKLHEAIGNNRRDANHDVLIDAVLTSLRSYKAALNKKISEFSEDDLAWIKATSAVITDHTETFSKDLHVEEAVEEPQAEDTDSDAGQERRLNIQ